MKTLLIYTLAVVLGNNWGTSRGELQGLDNEEFPPISLDSHIGLGHISELKFSLDGILPDSLTNDFTTMRAIMMKSKKVQALANEQKRRGVREELEAAEEVFKRNPKELTSYVKGHKKTKKKQHNIFILPRYKIGRKKYNLGSIYYDKGKIRREYEKNPVDWGYPIIRDEIYERDEGYMTRPNYNRRLGYFEEPNYSRSPRYTKKPRYPKRLSFNDNLRLIDRETYLEQPRWLEYDPNYLDGHYVNKKAKYPEIRPYGVDDYYPYIGHTPKYEELNRYVYLDY